MPATAMLTRDILALKSSEANLICDSGHIAGHPNYCPQGCTFKNTPTIGAGLVSHVVILRLAQYRAASNRAWQGEPSAPTTIPLTIENGWLIDGHHRAALAVVAGIPTLQVEETKGNLIDIQAHHAYIREHSTVPGAVPLGHRPTPKNA